MEAPLLASRASATHKPLMLCLFLSYPRTQAALRKEILGVLE